MAARDNLPGHEKIWPLGRILNSYDPFSDIARKTQVSCQKCDLFRKDLGYEPEVRFGMCNSALL